MTAFVTGPKYAPGLLHCDAAFQIERLSSVILEFDGWQSATAAVIRHLQRVDHRNVLIVAPWRIRTLPKQWQWQPSHGIATRFLCNSSYWLGSNPPDSTYLLINPAFRTRR